MSRPTIADIAHAAGVSSTAVSFALNGRPGLAPATRERIKAVADEMGWVPSAAARALSTSRVNALGLVITTSFEVIPADTFYLHLITGIERELAGSPVALVLKIVETFEDELRAIRQWHGESRVDGVVLVNPRLDDPRPGLVHSLGLPAVFIGRPPASTPVSTVEIDDEQTMATLLADLAAMGCRSLAYVRTVSEFEHDAARQKALQASDTAGIAIVPAAPVTPADGDLADQIDERLNQLVQLGLPDVIVCEDEMITLAMLHCLTERGLRVPEDVGLVSWESTPGLVMRSPRISTLERSPAVLGEEAVRILRGMRERGAQAGPVHRSIDAPRLVVRDSLRPVSGTGAGSADA